MKTLKLFDVVALTTDLPEENLEQGQVGTIVEVYNKGEAFEVEFVDRDGRTYGLLTLRQGVIKPPRRFIENQKILKNTEGRGMTSIISSSQGVT